MTKSGVQVGDGLARAILLAFCALFWIFLQYRFFHLDSLYYYRWDDVTRTIDAWRWSRNPSLYPKGDWLPLPVYISGSVLWLVPRPHWVPLQLNMAAGCLVLLAVGSLGFALFPKKPFAGVAAALAAAGIPEFAHLCLSAGAEVEMWLFLLCGLLCWIRFVETRRSAYLAAHVVFLILLSMTRYEGWIFIAAFLALAAIEARKLRRPYSFLAAYAACVTCYILFFILFQELSVIPFKRAHGFSGLALSYSGIRLMFRVPNAYTILSFSEMPKSFLLSFPVLAILGLSGLLFMKVDAPLRRTFFVLLGSSFVALSIVGGVFGTSPESRRLVVVFYLLLAPFFGGVLSWAARRLAYQGVALSALLILIVLNGSSPPPGWSTTPQGGADPVHKQTAVIAKAILEREAESGGAPGVLFQLRGDLRGTSYDFLPLQYALLGSLVFDRKPIMYAAKDGDAAMAPSSLLDLSREELEASLKQRRIELIVTHRGLSAGALSDVARPIAKFKDVELFGYELTSQEADFYARRIGEIRGKMGL